MIVDLQEINWNLPKDLLTLQSNYPYPNPTTTFMETRVRRTMSSTIGATTTRAAGLGKGLKGQEHYHYDQGNKHKIKKAAALPVSYFSSESMALLICLTASLLFLPLILPPLPPPPFLLLLLPICILGLLMILAFMPSNVRGLAYM